jgi:hypothetical protein
VDRCGAWKKVAPEIRKPLRDAIVFGGDGMWLRVLIEGLKAGLDDEALAESIASAIRERGLNYVGGGSLNG